MTHYDPLALLTDHTSISKNILFLLCMYGCMYMYQCMHTDMCTRARRIDRKLEALRERRPPWPRQIITPILSTVKMLSLGCERLPTPLKKKKKKKKKRKGSGSLPSPRSGYATTITVFFCSFTHLTIPRSPPKFNQFLLVLLRTRP